MVIPLLWEGDADLQQGKSRLLVGFGQVDEAGVGLGDVRAVWWDALVVKSQVLRPSTAESAGLTH